MHLDFAVEDMHGRDGARRLAGLWAEPQQQQQRAMPSSRRRWHAAGRGTRAGAAARSPKPLKTPHACAGRWRELARPRAPAATCDLKSGVKPRPCCARARGRLPPCGGAAPGNQSTPRHSLMDPPAAVREPAGRTRP
jgi:hypothetical protein